MNRLFKLAAAMLALVLFATPLAAFANCSPKAAMAGHCGGEDCPMMQARQQSGMQVSEAPSGDGSCCQMSSLPPSRTKPAVANETKASAEPPSSQSLAIVVTAPTMAATAGPPMAVLAVGPQPQAVLCTFLV